MVSLDLSKAYHYSVSFTMSRSDTFLYLNRIVYHFLKMDYHK